jgi:hypothetical protein
MKISKLLAVGALALTCMLAFAVPASAADVLNSPCSFDLIDPAPVAAADEVCAIDLDAEIILAAVISPGDEDEAAVTKNCSNGPAWMAASDSLASKVNAVLLDPCRRYDPGWLRA